MFVAREIQTPTVVAARFRLQGVVQGVGFRPFVYRLAHELGLTGWVRNGNAGVEIHAEGSAASLDEFAQQLVTSPPQTAVVTSLARETATVTGKTAFRILESDCVDNTTVVRVPPDQACCRVCRREILTETNRRLGHPFATCTECGPRYSIIRRMPYDRADTTMARFPLCPKCRAEYADPSDRRFHAQPIACPDCGPTLTLLDDSGVTLAQGTQALTLAQTVLRAGSILAVKGLGGFQLLVRADQSTAVARLRALKGRPTKPLAVMVASRPAAQRLAQFTAEERRLLESPENPIVLVKSRPGILAPEVAPGLGRIGLFLPTTPLHILLLRDLDFPVVATSGNYRDEPILIDEHAAVARLHGMADAFLIHDRPIERRVDDSVVRSTAVGPIVLRLARGYAPLPLPALERWLQTKATAVPGGVLAVGGQQKSAIALWTGAQAILSPHIGDLEGPEARTAFAEMISGLTALYACAVQVIACDQHPDYYATRWATEAGKSVLPVQHHHAHAVACMVEHDLLDREVLAFTWDGTGYGPDGTVWGGEVMRARMDRYQRVASLRPFPLLGGEAAIRSPARVALALLAGAFGLESVLADRELLTRLHLTYAEARILLRLAGDFWCSDTISPAHLGESGDGEPGRSLRTPYPDPPPQGGREKKSGTGGIHAPSTSSVGRLFDGIAALLFPDAIISYEGEAAVLLEASADPEADGSYPLCANGDWRPLVRQIVQELRVGVSSATIAGRFHRTLTNWAVAVAERHLGLPIVLGGGCFQNQLLVEGMCDAFRAVGRTVYPAGHIPPGDGGLAVGQLAVALARLTRGEE